jgi:signal transduction histidine kinase
MTRVGARRLAVAIWGLCVVLALATSVLLAIGPDRADSADIFAGVGGLSFLVLGLTFALVGWIVAVRVPENRIGWIFSLTGLAYIIQLFTWQYADVGLNAAAVHLPGTTAAAALNSVMSEATAGLLGLSLLLFPDGHLPSRRWRPAMVGLVLGMALLVIAGVLHPGRYDAPFAAVSNPLGLAGARSAIDAVDIAGWLFVIIGVALGAAAMVVRLRRADGIERQQLKLVLAVGAAAAIVVALAMTTWLIWPQGGLRARIAVIGFAFATYPVAASIAILRYRLYDIDFVLNRTLVYGALTLLLGAAFAATTLVLGTALGSGSAWATAGATLLVAVAFRPLRARLQDAVDRRFNRARYDALRRMRDFLEDLRAGQAAPEDVEGVLRKVLGDPGLALLFFLPESEIYVDSHGHPVTQSTGGDLQRIPVERAGRPLAIVLHDPARQEDPSLLPKVVEAGGLAIEIARLRVELRRQLNEVEESRTRIVEAAYEERRRIERDLHDGAQQRLVSIGLALRHAQHELAGPSPSVANQTLEAAVDEAELAIEELRELARGLPPAQLDHGLAPALRELANRVPLPVDLRITGERFTAGLEAAAYFIACEGLTNAVKHAQATRILLRAARENGNLVVSVSDDGVGGAAPSEGSGLGGLTDRVVAQGGTLRIDSERGAGTQLVAELPCGS